MSAAASLQLFPSPPQTRLTEENIQRITELARETVQARKQTSTQASAASGSSLARNTSQTRPPKEHQSAASSSPATTTSRVLVSPMDGNYTNSPVRESSEMSRLSPQSTRSSPRQRQNPRTSVQSATSAYSDGEPQFRSPVQTSSADLRSDSPALSQVSTARSSSPTLIATRSNSRATARTHHASPSSSTDAPPQIRSMFPAYDPDLPLSQQTYRPAKKLADAGGPGVQRQTTAQRQRRGTFSTVDDMKALWELANGQKIEKSPRPFRLQVHHRSIPEPGDKTVREKSLRSEPLLSFGCTKESPFFSVYASTDATDVKSHVEVRRHNPTIKASSIPVADFSLARLSKHTPTLSEPSQTKDEVTTSFTPKLATLLALESINEQKKIGATPYENALEASNLSSQAIDQADCKHGTIVLYEPLTNEYFLCHPSFGILPLQVSGRVIVPNSLETPTIAETKQPAAHVSRPSITCPSPPTITASDMNPVKMHPIPEQNPKPSPPALEGQPTLSKDKVTPPDKASLLFGGRGTINLWTASSDPKRRVLASLNFHSGTLMLNTTALAELDDLFVIDTVVSALVAVALAEVRRMRAASPPPTPNFPGPPMRVSSGDSTKSRSLGKSRWSIEIRDGHGEPIGGEDVGDLPRMTRGIVKGVQVAAGAATALVGVAAKLTTGTVVRASRVVSKT